MTPPAFQEGHRFIGQVQLRQRRVQVPLPPCLPLPWAMLGLPVSSTAKVMYARLLDAALAAGAEDANGSIFARCPIAELAGALGRSAQTQKRALRELEDTGLLLLVRQGLWGAE